MKVITPNQLYKDYRKQGGTKRFNEFLGQLQEAGIVNKPEEITEEKEPKKPVSRGAILATAAVFVAVIAVAASSSSE